MLISSNSTDIPSSKSPWRIWILFKHKNATSHEWRYIALKLFWIQFLWLWEYKSFVQCVLFLLQYYILFSHSSANDDIISLFLYYMEFVKLQQDGLSLKRFVCLIRHQICNPFCNTRVLWFQWFCKVIIGYGDVIAYKIPINN